MSYSFQARGATKQDALDNFSKKFDEVMSGQPEHAIDRESALNHAAALCDLCQFDPSADVVIDAFGSIGWRVADSLSSEKIITSAGGNVSVYQMPREME